MMRNASADRLAYLDGLRGIAALAVALFAHYGHFAQPIRLGPGMTQAPGYRILAPLYGYSWTAVELFFAISGVVFAHVYANRLPNASEFALRRFARLYPLHLVTLVVVAVLVLIYQHLHGRPPVYDNNDIPHFLLNIAFAQYGLFSEDWSFNGPSYSLAIEAIMYFIFYLAARHANLDLAAWMLCSGGVLFLVSPHPWHHVPLVNDSIAIGLVGFFGGVISFRNSRLACLLPVGLAALVPISGNLFCKVYAVIFTAMLLIAWSKPIKSALSLPVFTWLGDRSLAIYLIHFPLQVGIMLVFGPELPFSSFGLLAGYALLLLLAAHTAYHLVERPAQAWIRRLSAKPASLKPHAVDSCGRAR